MEENAWSASRVGEQCKPALATEAFRAKSILGKQWQGAISEEAAKIVGAQDEQPPSEASMRIPGSHSFTGTYLCLGPPYIPNPVCQLGRRHGRATGGSCRRSSSYLCLWLAVGPVGSLEACKKVEVQAQVFVWLDDAASTSPCGVNSGPGVSSKCTRSWRADLCP